MAKPAQKVSPQALEAFYRLRSQNLRNNSTTTENQNKGMEQAQQEIQQKDRPADMGILEYVMSALGGHPGVRK